MGCVGVCCEVCEVDLGFASGGDVAEILGSGVGRALNAGWTVTGGTWGLG